MYAEYSPFKQWAKENGISAKDISDTTGCSVKAVYAWFQGVRTPSRKMIKALNSAFNIDFNKVFNI